MTQTGLKTTLKIGQVLVGNVTEIGTPEVTTDSIETTTLDDDFRKYTPGLSDAGDISISGYYIKGNAGQTALRTAQKNKTIDTYVIDFPNGVKWTIQGFITSLKAVGDANLDDVLGFDCTIKVNGEPVLTETA